jgi:phosphatidate cytidylyltransferase
MADSPPTPAASKAIVFVRRTTSTLLLWGLVAAAFASMNIWAYLGLIGALAILATFEYFKMLRDAEIKCFPIFGIVVSVVYCATLYANYIQGETSVPLDIDALAVFLLIAGSFALQLRYPVRGIEAFLSVAATLTGFVYLAFLFNFSARLVFIVPGESQVPGAFVLLWMIAVTKFTDMGAYITGSAIGKHKMIPHISPGKTWEGFVGALFFSQLAACGLYALLPEHLAIFQNWGHVIFLGFLLAILAVIGDLAESVVKRSLNAKDSGHMLPGIGGALDLIDSLCFTAPALYFYIKWVLLPHA